MDRLLTIYVHLHDPKLVADFKTTLEREDRSMKAVVERALRNYVAQSKAQATVAAETAGQAA